MTVLQIVFVAPEIIISLIIVVFFKNKLYISVLMFHTVRHFFVHQILSAVLRLLVDLSLQRIYNIEHTTNCQITRIEHPSSWFSIHQEPNVSIYRNVL